MQIPEISWLASFASCKQVAEVGDKFDVKIIRFNPEDKQFVGSVREQFSDPWVDETFIEGKQFVSRVVRYVDKADRCCDNPFVCFPGQKMLPV